MVSLLPLVSMIGAAVAHVGGATLQLVPGAEIDKWRKWSRPSTSTGRR